MTVDFAIEPLAEDALLLRFGEGIDLATNALVHAAARALRAAAVPGVVDIAPAYATLLVRLDPLTWIGEEGALPFERIGGRLRSIVEAVAAESSICGLELPPHPSPLPQTMEPFGGGGDGRESRDQGERQKAAQICATIGRVIEIPVRYGGESGPDFDAVAEHARLTREEVIERHTAAEYTVAMLGFAPGFPYLLGLDSALHMPRRANPRTRVPAGSVAIGGAQTGIYPRELPGGWQLIGRTPQVLFDPERQPPCLLAPGDRVRFVAIDSDAFARRSGGAR